jgi:GTP pyrophosphokinase
MLHICFSLFFIYNFTDLLVKSFEKNTNKIIRVIDNNLDTTLIHNNLDIYYERRIKSKKRIFLKIKKPKIPYDIFGLRVIYNDNADYYNTKSAYNIKNIIQENFNTLDFISDDYIEKPKANNYQSLHLYVVMPLLIEIQIRNSYMHNIAINGSASHYY